MALSSCDEVQQLIWNGMFAKLQVQTSPLKSLNPIQILHATTQNTIKAGGYYTRFFALSCLYWFLSSSFLLTLYVAIYCMMQ